MEMKLSFDDVNLVPAAWNDQPSREAVDTSSLGLKLPMISSNMDTVYSPELSHAIVKHGGISVVHRFCDIQTNVKLFQDGIYRATKPWVSIGITDNERERGLALLDAGAEVLVIDVANAANDKALAMYNYFVHDTRVKTIVVGNFGTAEQIRTFIAKTGIGVGTKFAVKVSIGSGSACTTRQNTGIGVPSFSCLQDCVKVGIPVIFDGGIKTGGDFAKAMAAGASAVMMGRLFAACEESPGQLLDSCGHEWFDDGRTYVEKFKKYRGSASAESYAVQGKLAKHRAAEGESYLIPVSGTVEALMDHFNGCLRSTMTQQNAWNLSELRENAEFIQVTHSGNIEGTAYGKN